MTKSWTVSEDGPDMAPVRASQVLVCAHQCQQFFSVPSIIYSPDASPSVLVFLFWSKGFRWRRFSYAYVQMEVHYWKETVALPAPRQSHLYSRASAVVTGLLLLLMLLLQLWGHLDALIVQR